MRDATQPVNSGGAGAYPVIAVCGLAFEAAIAAGPGVVTLCGLGSERLAARLEDLIVHEVRQCRGIISFGTAGGLDPALPPGACVIADEIAIHAERFPVDASWLRSLRACLPEATQGTLAGVNQPMHDAAEKARLWQSSGAYAVDMESHRAALIAQRHRVPFAACRVVLDPAHRTLPAAATAGLRDDGTMALMQILRALATRPGQLSALIRLASDAATAKRALRAVRSHMGVAFAMPPRAGQQYTDYR
jgi:hopanoid-associated phosphorylase